MKNPYTWPGLQTDRHELIIELICNRNRITPQELTAKTNKRSIVYLRFLAMRKIKSLGGYSDERIAAILNKDRTTVIAGLKKYQDLTRYPDFQEMVRNSGFEI